MVCSITFNVIDWNGNLLDWMVRIIVATICGFGIGYERKSRSKEAGIRTHAIVCMASAIMMIVSKYGFSDIEKVDYARLAAQVISGIGFLGAGIIFVRRDMLHGLTTAAGIWTTAGIGLAIGAGMYAIGILSAVLLVVIQIILHRPLRLFRENVHDVVRVVAYLEDDETIEKIKKIFAVSKFLQFKTTNTDAGYVADIEIATTKQLTAADIYAIMQQNPFLKTVERNEEMT